MDDPLIRELWSKDRKGADRMTRKTLAELFAPRIRRGGLSLGLYVKTQLAMLVAILALTCINVAGYLTNPTLVAVHVGILALALGILAYSGWTLGELGRLERTDRDLASLVRSRLTFYRSGYELWLAVAALTPALLSFAIVALIDNDGGTYRINKPLVFVGANLAMLGITYGAARLSLRPVVEEARAVLADLEAQLEDRTREIDQRRGRHPFLTAGLMVLLALLLVAGLVVAFLGYP